MIPILRWCSVATHNPPALHARTSRPSFPLSLTSLKTSHSPERTPIGFTPTDKTIARNTIIPFHHRVYLLAQLSCSICVYFAVELCYGRWTVVHLFSHLSPVGLPCRYVLSLFIRIALSAHFIRSSLALSTANSPLVFMVYFSCDHHRSFLLFGIVHFCLDPFNWNLGQNFWIIFRCLRVRIFFTFGRWRNWNKKIVVIFMAMIQFVVINDAQKLVN